ncbi:MAG TPA: bifunctional diguanylate cyclase/phosphodiesterase [Kineosporiaceae bacterium]|nr:bifunctional diguanylate cyclase/phosphodiesterase [Kineosporiaceae bacterium]
MTAPASVEEPSPVPPARRPGPAGRQLIVGLASLQILAVAVVTARVATGGPPSTAGWAAVAPVVVVTAIDCAVAAWRLRDGRPGQWPTSVAWSLLAVAHLLLGVALVTGGPPIATVAFVPLSGLAVIMLHRRVPRWVPGHWWDALVVLLGSFAVVGAALAAVRPGGPAPSGLPAPTALAALACLALAGAALASRRSRPVVWWVAGGFATVAVGEALQGAADAGSHPGLPQLLTAVGFSLVGVAALTEADTRSGRPDAAGAGAARGADRRRAVPAGLPARALSWAFGAAALLVVGARLAGVPVAMGSALVAWAAIGVLLVRGAVTIIRGRTFADDRTDRLTGLASREAISEALAGEGAVRGDVPPGADDGAGRTDRVALLLADIDGFDEINVALGREAGDAVLTEVGARLKGVLRPPQLLARLGGDEFAVLLPGAGTEPATRVATALREALTPPLDVDGTRLTVQATVGVATCVLPRGRPEDLLRQADAAVHRAKSTGSGVAVYDPAKDGAGAQRLHRIDELRAALERGNLVVHLQPQVDLGTGRIVGCEALARWWHPDDGVLLPGAFLPLAAHSGLLRPVAAVILDRALEACATWWPRHRVVVSVNLTADDLMDPGLTDRITGGLDRHALPPSALCVELVEDALVADPDAAAALLRRLQGMGVVVALDDFGTGYSSLAYLRDLPFDEVKLDRVFGADLRRRRTMTIVAHTVAMAHALGLRVVAEGVEDAAAARTLADMGCDVGQGLLFGAATAPDAFLARLEASG